MTAPKTFWEDLFEDLKDPEFRRVYILENELIEMIDEFLDKEFKI